MTNEPPENGKQINNPDSQSVAKDEIPHNMQFIANFAQFNDRPDLLISSIEEFNPGFIKRATDNIEKYDETFRQKRFHFGDKQAYTNLYTRWLGVIFCLAGAGYIIWNDIAGFWNIALIILLLSGFQKGFSGINSIIRSITELIRSIRHRG